MGFDKLSAQLGGQPVLSHAIAAFCGCDAVNEVIVVCSEANEDWIKQVVDQANGSQKITAVVLGGSERHLSVWNGIEAARSDADLLGVHDGARPLITPDAIAHCAALAAETGAATLARPINDTVKRCDASGIVGKSIDRAGLWAMETPQIFHAQLLRDAYRAILDRGELVTDEVSAVQALGHPIKVVAANRPNLKITYPADLALAERMLGVS
jgi:2-C-methyl-D-erythritol 4-phosphate cytidylyltransferase